MISLPPKIKKGRGFPLSGISCLPLVYSGTTLTKIFADTPSIRRTSQV